MFKLKLLLTDIFGKFTMYEYAIILTAFSAFLLFFTLAVMLRRGFFSKLFYLLSFGFLLSTPLALEYAMDGYFYKVDAKILESRALTYTQNFYVEGSLTNTGLRDIEGCVLSLRVLRENALPKILKDTLNFIAPLGTYTQNIPQKIAKKESANFSVLLPNFAHEPPLTYRVDISCYGVMGIRF